MDDVRFREVFARAPVSIWEEDFSAVGDWLSSLRDRGVRDLRAFLKSDPEAVPNALALVRLIEVNEVTLRMWEVRSKEELLDRWTELFTDDTLEAFAEELMAIWEGRNELTFECSARTGTGRPIQYEMHWVAPMIDGKMNLGQVIVAIIDVTAHRRAEAALRRKADLAGRLSRRLLEVQERERLRLSRELHDEFGQLLSAATLNVRVAQREAGVAAKPELDDCIELLDRAARHVQDLALDLRPVMLDDFGLDAALRWLAQQHQRRTGVKTVVSGQLGAVPADVEVSCFRVVQEALTNIARHAQARRVWLRLAQEPARLQIVVQDDGVGFEVDNSHGQVDDRIRLGLLGMAERVEILGGQLEIDSRPTWGTSVCLSVPFAEVPEAGRA